MRDRRSILPPAILALVLILGCRARREPDEARPAIVRPARPPVERIAATTDCDRVRHDGSIVRRGEAFRWKIPRRVGYIH